MMCHHYRMVNWIYNYKCTYAISVYHSLIFCFCDVMVSVLDFVVVDLVRSIQLTIKMCICCILTKHAAFRNKDTMTRSQVNVLSDATFL